MSTAKGAPPRAGKAAPASSDAVSEPPELSVLVIQVEALEHDEAIRCELKSKGFAVKHQAMVTLTDAEAREFVVDVCDPQSEGYQTASASGGSEAEATPTSSSNAAQDHNADNEATEDAIASLSSGPALVLGVEKVRAIADLQQLVGPIAPDMEWHAGASSTDASLSLRSRFGKNSRQVGLRCSQQQSTVRSELAFLLARAGSGPKARVANSQARRATAASAAIGLDQLLSFLFPPHQQHADSAGRLFVFALYGPLDAKSRLHSGEKGRHVVTDGELATMSRRMEREDILAVYRMCSLSQEDEEQVVSQVDHVLKNFPQYTPRDITTLFESLPRDADGKLSFHDMQQTVLKERCRRVLCMKERVHPALAPAVQNAYRLTLKRLAKTKSEIAPPSMFLKDVGATGAENATLVTRLLSNHVFEIAQFGDGNAPELTQNVRLLREDVRAPSETRPSWNPNCQRNSDPFKDH